MGDVVVVNHPLVKHKLSLLRDVRTNKKDFRELAAELTAFLMMAATWDLELKQEMVETPVGLCLCEQLAAPDPYVFQILRAGQGMLEAALRMLPMAHIGTSGIYRDEETLEAVTYFHKPKKIEGRRDVFVVDPMLATANTAIATISHIKQSAEDVLRIRMLSIIAAPEGVKALQEAHPEVGIYVCVIDDRLNEKGYIVPGLGDAGDRLFGTK